MAMDWWRHPKHTQLLHRISLLHLANEVCEHPQKTSSEEEEPDPSSQRVLTLKQEKNLVEAFVYIAASTDDPRKIIAVSVQENSPESLQVNLAINHGRLESVHSSFLKIGRILERVARNDAWESYAAEGLFAEIIGLNQNRILARLRSRHARLKCQFKKEKMRQQKPLLKFAGSYRDVFRSQVTESSETSIGLDNYVASVLNAFKRLEAMEDREKCSGEMLSILQGLVKDCCSIKLGMAKIINRLDDSSNLRVIVKVARYQEVTNFLVRAARRFSPFRHVQVLPVTLIPSPLGQADMDMFTSDIIQEWQMLPPRDSPLRRISSASLSTVTDFLHNTQRDSFPVHAEIQLLVYHELHPSSLPPRMICASKLACFLCHLFFHVHGKYLVPGTHGRLYEKWALPKAIEQLQQPSLEYMRVTLDGVVRDIENRLVQLLETHQKPRHMPYESLPGSSLVLAPTSVVSPSVTTDGLLPGQNRRNELTTADDQQAQSTAASVVSSSHSKDAGDSLSERTLAAYPQEDQSSRKQGSASASEPWHPGAESTAVEAQLAKTKLTELSPYFEWTTKNMSLLFAHPTPFARDGKSLSTTGSYESPESLDLTISSPSLVSQTIVAGEQVVDLASIKVGEEKTVCLAKEAWNGRVLVQYKGEALLFSLSPSKERLKEKPPKHC